MHRLMTGTMWSRAARLACALGFAAVASAMPAVGSAATAVPYSLQVNALTGPQGGLLRIEVDAEAPAPAVETLSVVQVSVNGATIRVLRNVAAPAGVAEIELGPVARGATVSASVHVRSSTHGRARSVAAGCDRATAAGSRRRGRPRAAADAHDAGDRRGRRYLRAERRRRRGGHADTHARSDPGRRAEDGDGAEGRRHLGPRSRT